MTPFRPPIQPLTFAMALLLALLGGGCASADRPGAGIPLSRASKVLMIGDSMTCGPFGDQLEAWLVHNLGQSRVAVYGACGSSPESWLASQKAFISPCGYRETTSQQHILEESRPGHRAAPIPTPKIEQLLAKYRPQIVIVQLGTNHYDNVLKDGKACLPKLAAIYESFSRALNYPGGPVRMVIWITPPDSSKFPKWVEDEVDRLIITNNRRHTFGSIVSRAFTHYVPGVTGSDGVHYNTAGAALWSGPVIRKLDATFSKYRVKN